MHFALAFAILIALLPNFFPEAGTDEKTAVFTSGYKGEIRIREDVEPFSQEKFRNIINQEHDFSCGSAALATLLNFYLNEKLGEKQVIRGLMEFGDKEQIKQLRAFSLWDMQQFLEAIGYKSGGYKATMEDLENKEYWPCIIPINVYNYKHFVVLKGIYKDHVFVADPFIGNSSYSMDKFKKIWDDSVMFIVWADKEKTVTGLKLSRKDLRYIDKEFQETLMTPVPDPTNKIEDYRLDDQGPWDNYKK
ncbi:MAG: C39 family peptidase [Desulforegulaceae bacterium]|nr:C39 family peptidase [Desulforegulaceae bacterium]